MTTYVSTSDPQGWADMARHAADMATAPSTYPAGELRTVLAYLSTSTPCTLRLADITSGHMHENVEGCEDLLRRFGRYASTVEVTSYDVNDVTVRIDGTATLHFDRVGYLGTSYGPVVANLVGMLRYCEDGTTWFAYRTLGDLIVDRSNGTIGLRGFQLA